MDNTGFKVYIEEKTQDYGRLYIEPLERGYGDTLGNALRRLLLSSIRGAAATAVRIDGVLHEFSTIKGVREDVIEILMNLKHIPIKAKAKPAKAKDGEPAKFKIITLDSEDLPKDFFTRKVNPGVITAKDMPWDNEFEFCGDGVLCTLEPDAKFLMEIYVERGVGYLSAERERPSQPSLPVDALLTDAVFSPVKRVNYQIKPARVGQSIDYERLMIEVWTNGAVTPDEAVSEAARIAQSYFGQIAENVASAPQFTRTVEENTKEPEVVNVLEEDETPYDHPIHELELSIRSENCLLRGGIKTIGDLLNRSRDDLLKIRNLGKKSLNEIEDRLVVLGYELSKENSDVDLPEIDDETDLVPEQEPEEIQVTEPEVTEVKPEELPEPEPEPKPKAKSRAKAKPKTEKPEKTPKTTDKAKASKTTKTAAKSKSKARSESAEKLVEQLTSDKQPHELLADIQTQTE